MRLTRKKPRTVLPALAVCALCVVLAPLTGCGSGSGSGATSRRPSPSEGAASASGVPGVPAESRRPSAGKGSLAVHPGGGAAPVTRQLPEVPKELSTCYGPGGFATTVS
ncbi:hypothetical protein ACTMUQ_08730 [Streptomyces sp. SD11]|uniref:hypothetical protein n=1 Tax=Streptomyces sp. SD11 TaxID=3452209 RepID=UPI003F888D96